MTPRIRDIRSPATWARFGAVFTAGAALLAWSGDALAAGPPPKAKELSAISQYRESIPTPTGPTFLGSGEKNRVTPLPKPAENQVAAKGGSDAQVLRAIAEASSLGAPQESLPPIKKPDVVPPSSDPVPAAIFSAAGKIQVDAQGGRLLGLAVILALTTLAAVVAPLARRRRRAD